MKYDLLFYKSKKTSYCEKALKKHLGRANMETNRVISSVSPESLGQVLCESLTICSVVVIIGGFSINDSENIVTVLSRAMSNTGLTLNNTRKLRGVSQNGYMIKYARQMIISLPDDPCEIKAIVNDSFISYISSIYE